MSGISTLLLALALSLPAAAQEKTVKFLVGFPAGAGLDTMTRLVADRMRLRLGQPVVVENRPGAGSLPHFFSLLFADTAGISLNHIGYKGTAPALTDLLGGQIAAFMGTVSDLANQQKAGRLRVLATSGAQRARDLPDVPTFRELGFNIEGSGWYAAYAPAKTPRETVDRLANAIVEAIRSPDVREKLEALGMEPTGLGAAELARIHRADYDKWGPVIKASGFKLEN